MKRGILSVLAVCAGYAADATIPTCKPVMITAGSALPTTIGFGERPMGHMEGCKISYLVEGQDLIGFKKDSLTITSILGADGKDISQTRMGKKTWKMGHFPKTTDDGKYGIFEIEISENVFGKTDGLVVNGSITANSGSDLQSKKLTFAVDDKKVETLGAMKVSLKGDENSFGVQVEGALEKVNTLTVLDGSTPLNSQGTMSFSKQKTYNFSKPSGKSVTVEISYWNKLTEVIVPIGGEKKK
jgi:hypothetical protein